MWLTAEYLPTTLFSLRPASATSSGGKSLLAPTPFAVKMALLDAAIRTQGLDAAQEQFAQIRDVDIAIRLPEQIVLNSTFTKILRIKEIKFSGAKKEAATAQARVDSQWPFQHTIAYREYVQFAGPLAFSFQSDDITWLTPLLLQVNYLGKRGGFMQLASIPMTQQELSAGFTLLTRGITDSFPLGTLQILDDFGDSMTFAHANIFDSQRVTLGTHRILRHVVLPYQMKQSSRSYTLYERLPES